MRFKSAIIILNILVSYMLEFGVIFGKKVGIGFSYFLNSGTEWDFITENR